MQISPGVRQILARNALGQGAGERLLSRDREGAVPPGEPLPYGRGSDCFRLAPRAVPLASRAG
jgi:hypothetical protein